MFTRKNGRVSQEFPQVSEEEMQSLQNIVKEAAYGPAGASAEDGQFVRWVYFRLAEQVLQRMKGFKRLIFRYGKGFG